MQYIGKEAFKDLPGLQGHLTFGSQLQSLGEGVFAGCSGLNGVDFRFCENEQMTDIPDNAFYSCFLLKDVALPPNLASIGKDAFNECRLIDKIELPRDNMEFSLGVGTFSHCYSLINFSKPCTITSIGDNCFSGDTSLSQSFVPWKKGGLQTIAKDAFAQTNYSVLTFYSGYPSEVLDNAFDECSLLGNIDFSQYDSIEPPQ
ncbi:MAG: leucine-rich repeat domain-containing protein [Mycoplasmoidaceae bacterium]|nr:leucine-rich repeat domain-containing protein [Mycoplasmoidaceae bacterium]